jgi:hypothetical protein
LVSLGSPGKIETNYQLDYPETRNGVEPVANFAQDLQASLGAYETASDESADYQNHN